MNTMDDLYALIITIALMEVRKGDYTYRQKMLTKEMVSSYDKKIISTLPTSCFSTVQTSHCIEVLSKNVADILKESKFGSL